MLKRVPYLVTAPRYTSARGNSFGEAACAEQVRAALRYSKSNTFSYPDHSYSCHFEDDPDQYTVRKDIIRLHWKQASHQRLQIC
jgi:hypothetical protein